MRGSYLARLPFANRYFRALAPLYPRAFESFDLARFRYDRQFDDRVGEGRSRSSGRGPRLLHQYRQPLRVCLRRVRSACFARPFIGQPDRLGSRGRQAPDALRRELAQRRRAHPPSTTAATPTCCIVPSTSIASRSAAAPATTFSSPRGCCPTSASISRSAPPRWRTCRCSSPAPARRSARCASCARGTTTTMLGYVSDERLNELLGNARAAIVPGEEDFGLVPLEAAAAGRPTIAYRGGGALETIVEGETGVFFDEPNRRVARDCARAPSTPRVSIRSACARMPSSFRRRSSSNGCARSSSACSERRRTQATDPASDERVRDARRLRLRLRSCCAASSLRHIWRRMSESGSTAVFRITSLGPVTAPWLLRL